MIGGIMTFSEPVAPSPWHRVVGAGVALAALLILIVLAFAWPGVTADPRHVPIVVAGPSAQVDPLRAALEKRAGDTFDIATVADRDTAVRRIEERRAYGAIVLGPEPEVLTSSAASSVVAQQLAALAPDLEKQLQQAVAARLPAGAAAPDVAVKVTDVVPLADTDPRGAGLVVAALPLVLGGMIGGAAISLGLVGTSRRLLALGLYAVVAGPALAGVLQGWLGVLQGSYLLNAGVLTVALLAIGAPIVGLATVFGRPGVAAGAALFVLGANPISSATQPVEFLVAPWGAVGQWFPPGAGATLVRDASYFPSADTAFPWLVLAGWALAGVVLVLIGAAARRNAVDRSRSVRPALSGSAAH
jgi:hypothetical protein